MSLVEVGAGGTADEYEVGRSDERRLEREATVRFLRHEASDRSPIVRDVIHGLAEAIERGDHRS